MSRVDERLAVAIVRSRWAALISAGDDRALNPFEAEELVSLALLLDDDATAAAVSAYLRAAPRRSLDDALHNLPPHLVHRAWTAPTLAEIRAKILPYEAWTQNLLLRAPWCVLARERRYREAFAAAPAPVDIADVVALQALNGDVDEARRYLLDPATDPGYATATRIVLAVEAFRHERADAGEQLALIRGAQEPWDEVQLARGVAGYQPWSGYPFCDY
jgi:hypothetical protein